MVGAGISGIGAGYHLQIECPNRTYAILEGRDDIGGTWDLFRYPGVRSDSDMHTLGYAFKPWTADKAIADGPVDPGLPARDGRPSTASTATSASATRSIAAEWSTDDVPLDRRGAAPATARPRTLTCNYLFMCAGYYSYDDGYTPEFAGVERFAGQIVHPQQWPEDLDYAGKRVVVIGSGATAMTLVPAMADDAAHVTMLQRSPTYVVSRPDADAIANRAAQGAARRRRLRASRGAKNIALQQFIYKRTRTKPDEGQGTGSSAWSARSSAPTTTSTPTSRRRYNPWDQRLCLVPDGDLFEAIRSGKASVVTDQIDTFTETGIELDVGRRSSRPTSSSPPPACSMVTLGEMDVRRRRRAGRLLADVDLQGLRLLRRAEPGLVVRLHQRLVDAARRPDRRVRLPAAQPHGRDRHRRSARPGCAPSDRVDAGSVRGSTASRSGYMQRVDGPPAPPGRSRAVDQPAELRRDKKMFRKSPIDDGVMRFTRSSARAAVLSARSW